MFIEYPIAPPLPAELIDADELLRRSLLAANSILWAEDSVVITELPIANVRSQWETCIVGRTLGAQRAARVAREGTGFTDDTLVALEHRFENGELPCEYYRPEFYVD